MSDLIPSFLKEQRHIFGLCPGCGQVSRLSDIQVSYRTRYVKDWLDHFEAKLTRGQQRLDEFETIKKELRQHSLERACRKLLPKQLSAVSPLFRRQRLEPQDVKVLLHPIDYVAFDGLVSNDKVKRVVLLDAETSESPQKKVQKSIQRAVDREAFDWVTLRVSKDGTVDIDN